MENSDEIIRKPQSLRSLANYSGKSMTGQQYTSQNILSNQSLDNSETELENSGATFIDVDSDLSQIFGNIIMSEETLCSDQIHLNGIDNEILNSNEILNLRQVIGHLQEENLKLTNSLNLSTSNNAEIHRLQEEITKLNDQISNLQFDIKERDDQVPIHIISAYKTRLKGLNKVVECC